MVALNWTVEAQRKDAGTPRPVWDGVYFTRFDTYETESESVFRCRMPGVQMAKVEAGMENGQLIIKGEVRFSANGVSSRSNSKPLAFFRSFPISCEVIADRITANFQDGVLIVRVPKAGEPRAIENVSSVSRTTSL